MQFRLSFLGFRLGSFLCTCCLVACDSINQFFNIFKQYVHLCRGRQPPQSRHQLFKVFSFCLLILAGFKLMRRVIIIRFIRAETWFHKVNLVNSFFIFTTHRSGPVNRFQPEKTPKPHSFHRDLINPPNIIGSNQVSMIFIHYDTENMQRSKII